MTGEVLYFILLVLFGGGLCIKNINSEMLYNVVSLFFLIGWSVVVRYSGFDLDMNNYANSLHGVSFSLYYLKEPVFWFGSYYLHELIGSEELVFVVYDSVSFIILLHVRKKWCLPKYFPFLWICFFPTVMGMQNVYRQFLSYHFLLYFFYLSYHSSSEFKRYVILLLGGLTHNVAFLFSPILFAFNKNKNVSVLFLFLSMSVLLLLPLALSSKSSSDTGVLGAEVYLIVMAFLLLFSISLRGFVLTGVFSKYYYIQCYFFILTLSSVLLMGNAQQGKFTNMPMFKEFVAH